MEINAGRRFAAFRDNPLSLEKPLTVEQEADGKVFIEYTGKYMRRAREELGIKT